MKLIISLNILMNSIVINNSIINEVDSYINNKTSNVSEILYVSIKRQKIFYIKNDIIKLTYTISSSKFGIGNKENSNKTPIGLHRIKEKHGEKTPVNGLLIGRLFYGNIAEIHHEKTKSNADEITSRILWLEGIEKGINKGDGIDSYERYIYIHGTSEEGLLGKPASHGCIRMSNKDVIDLYKKIEVGTLVLIL